MIQQLYVSKKFGNYADTFFMLGLAQLVEYALKATNQKSTIQIVDEGIRYCLKLKQTVNLEAIASLKYTNPFPPVKGEKTDASKIPPETEIFDTVEKNERRKLYRNYVFEHRGWERIYGLAQRLSSQAGSKKDFIIELSTFLASYENENLRIDEELTKKGKFRRIWTTKDDLDRVIHLIERFGSSLVANLLIAYGYAKGWGKAKDTEQTDSNNNLETEGESDND